MDQLESSIADARKDKKLYSRGLGRAWESGGEVLVRSVSLGGPETVTQVSAASAAAAFIPAIRSSPPSIA